MADPFVGRADGLATIEAAVAGASHGRGSLVLIAGEAGIGKTRLADEALRLGAEGQLVLWGSCSDGDGAPPFWPWTEALRPLIGVVAMPPEIVALLPGLAPEGATRPDEVADEIRFRAFNLVADLLDDVGRRRPVTVVLDDLHWADPSSLELLRTVARRSGTSHFTIVGTYRDTDVEPEHPLHRLLGELARAGPRVVLTGLVRRRGGAAARGIERSNRCRHGRRRRAPNRRQPVLRSRDRPHHDRRRRPASQRCATCCCTGSTSYRPPPARSSRRRRSWVTSTPTSSLRCWTTTRSRCSTASTS